jgi:hypothetical protein
MTPRVCEIRQAVQRLAVHVPLPKSRGPLEVALAEAAAYFDVPLQVVLC